MATFLDDKGNVITISPPAYCPTCDVTIGAARTPILASRIKNALQDALNTGKKKFDLDLKTATR